MTTQAPRVVAEEQSAGEVPLWRHPEWVERFGWLFQATTGEGSRESPFDLGLSGAHAVGEVMERWRKVRAAADLPSAVHSRQVHGVELAIHSADYPAGTLVMEGVDGHATGRPGLLLTVSVADCVPVFLVNEERRTLAVVHAGWRGVAGGIVERGIEAVGAGEGLWVHCGPAICGECYEVGPEVHEQVRPGIAPPSAPTPIDLRRAIAERAVSRGVSLERVTVSGHCTRCGPGGFFSHRAGSPARQMALLGRRE